MSSQQAEIKCVDDLYLKEKFADVWFSFGSIDGTVTRIPAHKLLLAVVSDVFEAMFFGGLKEKGDVVITDASANEFKEFLRYFYQRDAELTTENVAGVMNLGHKYNVGPCVDACVEHLNRNLTDENVGAALTLAILYDREELTPVCAERIQSNTVAVFQSAGFLECSKEALANILQLNPLSCSEVDVFEACMSWVQAKSQQNTVSKAMIQEHLGDLYYEIRFASMTIEEFCDLEEKYNEVLRDDFHTITRLIVQKHKNSERFNTSLRKVELPKIAWNSNEIIVCDRNTSSFYRWYELDTKEKLTFSTNQPLVLGSFVCNTIFVNGDLRQFLKSDLSIEVEISEARSLDDPNTKILSNTIANLGSRFKTVSLSQPILIQPSIFYTVCAKGFPERHCIYSRDQKSSVALESDIKIEFHNDKIVNGEIVSLIFQLNFNKI